jgi:DNA (cytosine-5)-methyltransferase 1
MNPCCVSLFSGGGCGDLGTQSAGVEVIACCELLHKRADVLRQLFPTASVFEGDIQELCNELVEEVRVRLGGVSPWLLVMSPPCQGMTLIGKSKGQKPDARNQLIIPAIEVVGELQPQWIVIENVAGMVKTAITNEFGNPELVMDLLRRRLPQYTFESQVVDAQHYGVPQHRERLITIGRRDAGVTLAFHAPPTHPSPVTLERATQHLAWLDSIHKTADDQDPVHIVPVWRPMVHFWMRHTPPGRSAFSNTKCVECQAQAGPEDVDCPACGSQLARPRIERQTMCRACEKKRAPEGTCACGSRTPPIVVPARLIKGFREKIYRRMRRDEPVPTLTTQSGYINSDIKGHPTQHRVLSLREILILSSVGSYPGFEAPWDHGCKVMESLAPNLMRQVVGEGIPPLLMFKLVGHLRAIEH